MGQGKSHALKFAENGFDVVLADMQDPEGETFKQTVAEIEAAGAKALAVRANITSDEDMQNLFREGLADLWRIDVVVANAGVINFGYTWELTDAQVQKVIDIDLIGTWRTDISTPPSTCESRDLAVSSTFPLPPACTAPPSWPPTAWPSGASAA